MKIWYLSQNTADICSWKWISNELQFNALTSKGKLKHHIRTGVAHIQAVN